MPPVGQNETSGNGAPSACSIPKPPACCAGKSFNTLKPAARAVINQVYIDDKIRDYIVNVVHATRDPAAYKIQGLQGLIQLGASPRATIALTLAAKAYAFLKGRGYVTPQDVKSIGMDVLRHRVAITYEAEAENKTSETIIQKIFDELPVP